MIDTFGIREQFQAYFTDSGISQITNLWQPFGSVVEG